MSQYVAPLGQEPVVVCVIAGTSWTVVSRPGAGMAPVVMWNERFCQNMFLSSSGFENFVQFGWPAGQVTLGLVITPDSWPLFTSVCSPATMKFDVVTDALVHAAGGGVIVGSQPGGGTLAFGALTESNNTPAVAVLSFDATVLWLKVTFNASRSETPPPPHPATLFTMTLLVTVTEYHLLESLGLRCTSVPFTFCSRKPPPLPPSAVLPWMRLESIVRPGPMPSGS